MATRGEWKRELKTCLIMLVTAVAAILAIVEIMTIYEPVKIATRSRKMAGFVALMATIFTFGSIAAVITLIWQQVVLPLRLARRQKTAGQEGGDPEPKHPMPERNREAPPRDPKIEIMLNPPRMPPNPYYPTRKS